MKGNYQPANQQEPKGLGGHLEGIFLEPYINKGKDNGHRHPIPDQRQRTHGNQLSQYCSKSPNKNYKMKVEVIFQLGIRHILSSNWINPNNYLLAFFNKYRARAPKAKLGMITANKGENPDCSAIVPKTLSKKI